VVRKSLLHAHLWHTVDALAANGWLWLSCLTCATGEIHLLLCGDPNNMMSKHMYYQIPIFHDGTNMVRLPDIAISPYSHKLELESSHADCADQVGAALQLLISDLFPPQSHW
jgi:hypothetical protein